VSELDSQSGSYQQAVCHARAARAAYVDSQGNERWGTYNLPIKSYEATFRQVLGSRAIVDLIRGKQAPVVVDLMASSAALADLYNGLQHLPDKRGIALGLTDMRSPAQKRRDSALGIMQLTGDLMLDPTWQELHRAVGVRGADLVLQRAEGGLDCLPPHRHYMAYAMNRVWNMTNADGGTILMQIPGAGRLLRWGIDLESWVENMRHAGANVSYNPMAFPGLLITRTPAAPAQIPCAGWVPPSLDTLAADAMSGLQYDL
jgi:hypothetical protein